MKRTIHRYNEFFRYIASTPKFRALYFVALIIAVHGGYTLVENAGSLKIAIFFPFTFNYFNLFVFCIFSILTIYTCSSFEQFNFYTIRMKTKKRYIIELLGIVIFTNFMFLLMFLFLFLAAAIVKQGFSLEDVAYFYDMSIGQYSIFYLLRYFILLLFTTTIITLLHAILNSKFTMLIVGILLCGFLKNTEFMKMDIVGFQWLPWKYFTTPNYESFTREIHFSLIYLTNIVLLIIGIIHLYLNVEKLKKIKYILINDIFYLWNKKKYVLILWIIIPIVVLLLVNLNSRSNLIDLVNSTMGTGINNESDNLSIIVYLFFLSLSIFIALDLFLKDMKSNLAIIFMRIKLNEWYIDKIIALSLIILSMKLLSYFIIFILIIIFKGTNGYFDLSIVNILIIDFISTLVIQLTSVLIYTTFQFSKTYKIVSIIVATLLLGGYVYMLSNKISYMIAMIVMGILIFIVSQFMFRKKGKTILQKVGGI